MTKADPPLVAIVRPDAASTAFIAQTVYRGRSYSVRRKSRTTAVRALTRTVLAAIK